MKINRDLLPIKAHWFFFMAAMGPILPQLSVYGKELGISSVVMGSVTGILPFAFLIAKPLFGMLVDVYREQRKAIFMFLILIMTLSYGALNFIPARLILQLDFNNLTLTSLDTCNITVSSDIRKYNFKCDNGIVDVICSSSCFGQNGTKFLAHRLESEQYSLCKVSNEMKIVSNNTNCDIKCDQDIESDKCLYKSLTFWCFIVLMAIGTIGFNVINSISDAICFDVIGEDYDYGKQRVWGTIGFGTTALISGYIVNIFSGSSISYAPAFMIMLVCSVFDFFACFKLKLPVIEAPENICKDLRQLLNNRYVLTFITFAVFVGVLDGLIIYFLFWYLEDLASATNTSNVKLIEGLIVAAETLGGEVIFFSLAGKILDRIGHVHCFSMCFLNYALRLGLISLAPSPWWIIPIEFFMQGPTYALTYTTIVAYANELSPPGTSATMQGIAAGMDDGVGYAIGSIVGGLLFRYIGGKHTLQVFSVFGVVCSVLHLVLHKTVLVKDSLDVKNNSVVEYKTTEEAYKATCGPN